VVAKRGHEDAVREILEKWDLTAAVIGEVIAEPVYRVTEGAKIVAEFPGSRLVTECPPIRPMRASPMRSGSCGRPIPSQFQSARRSRSTVDLRDAAVRSNHRQQVVAYRQYDSTVRTNTVIGPGGDAAVLRVRGTNKALAVKTDCNGRYVYLDPREADGSRWLRQHAMSPAPAHGRWRSRIASTSATRLALKSSISSRKQ